MTVERITDFASWEIGGFKAPLIRTVSLNVDDVAPLVLNRCEMQQIEDDFFSQREGVTWIVMEEVADQLTTDEKSFQQDRVYVALTADGRVLASVYTVILSIQLALRSRHFLCPKLLTQVEEDRKLIRPMIKEMPTVIVTLILEYELSIHTKEAKQLLEKAQCEITKKVPLSAADQLLEIPENTTLTLTDAAPHS